MSTWTHVAAIFRIDAVKGFFGPQSREEIKEVLGRGNCTLPCGSEGSLKYDIWENKDDCSVAAFTVSVFGDLRDYEETDSIRKWFDSFCSKFLIRQAVCLAQTEGCEAKVFKHTTFE